MKTVEAPGTYPGTFNGLNMCTRILAHTHVPHLKCSILAPAHNPLKNSIQCPVFRLSPRDRPLYPMAFGEFAECPLGLERTVFTGSDVAALPVGRPGPPGAQVLRHSLVGSDMDTLHTSGLEAIVAAGRCAQGP